MYFDLFIHMQYEYLEPVRYALSSRKAKKLNFLPLRLRVFARDPFTLGFEVQDQIDDAHDGQDNLDGNVELANAGMAMLDLGGLFEHVVFFVFSH